ncbi:Oidioi.mRNA.OKI2018_I69.chr1.g868.t1.cds [Oikopleura dioica]|uniref:Oidioi.mRNA.OKI2018_I69.chr1.g868.t1.cds n=1 Tax=Oikopleura dioica TaxID=34765 RepID=A0ABN7SMZ6_OIKDI|nr:Oidioi.mRNA.OKI2018_I69.chr1.g868.t1.cds [Oikopleura dioica]
MEKENSDEEQDSLIRLGEDKSFLRTLTRNQRYSLTRRIQAEYDRTKRNKRSTLPTAWTENQQIESDSEKSSSLPTKLHETVPEETQNCRHQLRFEQETTRKWATAIVIPPRTGNVSFSDLGERDMEFVQTACILHADAILRSLRERQLKIPKKTAVSTEGDLFEIDQDTLLNVDRHKLGAPWRQVPLLIDLLCKNTEEMAATPGIFRTCPSKKTIVDVKEKLVHLYREDRAYFDIEVREILDEEAFRNPLIKGGLLKEILASFPEPLCIKSFSPGFEAVAKLKDLQSQLELLNMLFLTLPTTNQYILRKLLRLFKRISENDEENKMSAKNIGICFAPTLFVEKHSKHQKTSASQIASMQAKMDSLILALEIMVEYHEIITLVPKSIVNQLRKYKMEMDKNRIPSRGLWKSLLPWKKQKEFSEHSIQKLISESNKFIAPVAGGENMSHRTIMLNIEDERRIQYKTVPYSFDEATVVKDMMRTVLGRHSKNSLFLEREGNLLEERSVPKTANLMSVFLENKGADFVLRTMPLEFKTSED